MSDIPHQLRFVLRSVRRAPGFFATAILILALGVGMSAAMFSLFRTVLVRQLPVVDQDPIVVMWTYATDPNTEVSLVTGVAAYLPARRATSIDPVRTLRAE